MEKRLRLQLQQTTLKLEGLNAHRIHQTATSRQNTNQITIKLGIIKGQGHAVYTAIYSILLME